MDGAGSQEPKATLIPVMRLHPPPKDATNFVLSEGADSLLALGRGVVLKLTGRV